MKSAVVARRRHIAYLIVYVTGVLSGITVYSVLKTYRFLHVGKIGGGFWKSSSEVNRDSPMVFVGGYPRSGTTLMRVLLDAHPDFYCGQETHIIPGLLALRRKFSRGRPLARLKEAGLDLARIDTTIAESILNIMGHRGPRWKRLCSKDPFTLKDIPYLSSMFPNAQFVLMVRDARGVVHSVREHNVTISNFPKNDKKALQRWSRATEVMFDGCLGAGSEKCTIVHYESLVLEPRFKLEKILQFLRADWSESVLKHTQFFNVSGGISLSSLEKSTNQVQQPIYNNSLYSWKSSSVDIPYRELNSLAPMMKILGYMEIGHPPKYSKLKEKEFLYQA